MMNKPDYFIHPDNIRYYCESKELIGVASRIWVSKLMDESFESAGYKIVKLTHG